MLLTECRGYGLMGIDRRPIQKRETTVTAIILNFVQNNPPITAQFTIFINSNQVFISFFPICWSFDTSFDSLGSCVSNNLLHLQAE